jgi:hypothetical protein
MKLYRLLILLLSFYAVAFARLDENRSELIARLGSVQTQSAHSVIAQGQISKLGPTFFFKKDQWFIQCDMIDDHCARIRYNKKGEWTAEQITTLLENNTGGREWREVPDKNKMIRKWIRSDDATATWKFTGVMEFVSPAYTAAKEKREAELKSRAQEKPDL